MFNFSDQRKMLGLVVKEIEGKSPSLVSQFRSVLFDRFIALSAMVLNGRLIGTGR